MAYQNPKPTLDDEKVAGAAQQQESSVADYAHRRSVYFAFIDVLGFKQTFDENRQNPNGEFASAFKAAFQYFSLLMNSANFAMSDKQWSAGQTSDSLYFYTDRIDFLATFIKIYSHFSLYAMSKNIFFRGGIAKGGLYVDKPYQFYGDSVIKAYLLESKIAKFPMVVMDQSTFDDLKKEETVVAFIVEGCPPARNYVKPFAAMENMDLQVFTGLCDANLFTIGNEELDEIRKNIQTGLERFEFDEKTYQKYAFLQKEFQKVENKKDT